MVSTALLGTGLTASSTGDSQSQTAGTRSAAAALRSRIAADSQQIASTSDGLARARDRLAAVQDRLDQRVAELKSVQSRLLAARNHLVDLENRLHLSTTALAANLVASYEGGQPDLVSVILSSKGFNDLLNQMGFMARVAHQDANIVKLTRTARAEVSRQATALGGLETREPGQLVNQVLDSSAPEARPRPLRSALLREQLVQETKRANTTDRFNAVKGASGLAAGSASMPSLEACRRGGDPRRRDRQQPT